MLTASVHGLPHTPRLCNHVVLRADLDIGGAEVRVVAPGLRDRGLNRDIRVTTGALPELREQLLPLTATHCSECSLHRYIATVSARRLALDTRSCSWTLGDASAVPARPCALSILVPT